MMMRVDLYSNLHIFTLVTKSDKLIIIQASARFHDRKNLHG